jgi:anaerobic magnesium-protoporphyrin IX monomethyl ester cyclase
MLKVLAVHPPYVGAPDIRYVPLGFALLLAQIRRHHDVSLLDLLNNSAGWRDVDRALAGGDYDVCLVSGFAMQVAGMREVVRRVRASSSRTRVVIGGVGVSDIPEIALRYTGADAVALGESETTVLPMLASIEADAAFEGVPGYAFRRRDALVQNPKAPLVRDLDALGLPAYDLFDVEAISRRSYNGWGYRSTFMESSRGCPFRCDFCINSVLNDPKLQSAIYTGATERNSTLRLRSVTSLVAEIRHLQERWGITDVVFSDEEFMTQKQRVFEVSNALKPLGITWLTSGRADWATHEKLQAMKEGGCRGVIFGVETGSQRMMDLMVKSAKKERVVAGLTAAREVGLNFLANFMIGHPGETAETIQESVDFCREMGLAYLPSYTTLFPNSRMFHERKAAIADWDRYFQALSTIQYNSNVLFNLTDLPDAELMRLRTRAIAQTLGFKLIGASRTRLVEALTPLLVACVSIAERLPRQAAFLLRNILRVVLDLRSSPARQIPPHALADTTRSQTDGYEESLRLLGEADLADGVPATFQRR